MTYKHRIDLFTALLFTIATFAANALAQPTRARMLSFATPTMERSNFTILIKTRGKELGDEARLF
jgi:hypothetical protein